MKPLARLVGYSIVGRFFNIFHFSYFYSFICSFFLQWYPFCSKCLKPIKKLNYKNLWKIELLSFFFFLIIIILILIIIIIFILIIILLLLLILFFFRLLPFFFFQASIFDTLLSMSFPSYLHMSEPFQPCFSYPFSGCTHVGWPSDILILGVIHFNYSKGGFQQLHFSHFQFCLLFYLSASQFLSHKSWLVFHSFLRPALNLWFYLFIAYHTRNSFFLFFKSWTSNQAHQFVSKGSIFEFFSILPRMRS